MTARLLQVDGLVGRSVWQAEAEPPLVAEMHALFLTPATWTMYRPQIHVQVGCSAGNATSMRLELQARQRGCVQGPVGVPLSDKEAQRFAVSGPYAADFEGNQYAGTAQEQTPEQRASRMAGLRSKIRGTGCLSGLQRCQNS